MNKMDDNSSVVLGVAIVAVVILMAGMFGGSCYISEKALDKRCNCVCEVVQLIPEAP